MKLYTRYGSRNLSHSLYKAFYSGESALRRYVKGEQIFTNAMMAGRHIHAMLYNIVLPKSDNDEIVLSKVDKFSKDTSIIFCEKHTKCDFMINGQPYDCVGRIDMVNEAMDSIADVKTYNIDKPEYRRQKCIEATRQIHFYHLLRWVKKKTIPKNGYVILVGMRPDKYTGKIVSTGDVEIIEVPVPTEEELELEYSKRISDAVKIIKLCDKL